MKRLFLLSVSLIMTAVILMSCGGKSADEGIAYPESPYVSDKKIDTDPYFFYNAAAEDTAYWRTANTHDPAIIKDGENYYVFSTDAQYGATTKKGIHIRKSADLINWSWVGTALDLSSVSEAVDYVEYNRDGVKVDFFWAPDIVKRAKPGGGFEYWLFYCNSSFGQRTSYMGMAKSDNIEGPYVHSHGILRTHNAVGGTPNAIDPAVFTETVDGAEKMWLSYGSWNGGIYIIELNPDTGEPLISQSLTETNVAVNTATAGVTTTKAKLIPSSSSDPAFGKKILNIYSAEAPYIIKEGGYYYLMATTGADLTYDYDVRVFRSQTIDGEYLDSEGQAALASTSASSFRVYGNKLTDSHMFDTSQNPRGWAAIGHNSAVKDGDNWYLAAHTRGTYMDKDRFFLSIRRMSFVGGWPVVFPNRYAGESLQDLSSANLSGSYKIHILNKAPNASVTDNKIYITKYAENITLTKKSAENGWYKVEGDYSGKWRFTGEYGIEISLGIKGTFEGIFAPQWFWEKNCGALSFTAVNAKGVSVWGVR